MTIAFVPGSFDPITLGHLDIIRRASKKYDEVVVAVLNNSKKNYLFSAKERGKLIHESLNIHEITGVTITTFNGLLVDLVKAYCDVGNREAILVKGLRTVTDFEYEVQMAHLNRDLGVETSFMLSAPEHSYTSSSMVKEVAKLGGEFERYVTVNVAEALIKKFNL